MPLPKRFPGRTGLPAVECLILVRCIGRAPELGAEIAGCDLKELSPRTSRSIQLLELALGAGLCAILPDTDKHSSRRLGLRQEAQDLPHETFPFICPKNELGVR